MFPCVIFAGEASTRRTMRMASGSSAGRVPREAMPYISRPQRRRSRAETTWKPMVRNGSGAIRFALP